MIDIKDIKLPRAIAIVWGAFSLLAFPIFAFLVFEPALFATLDIFKILLAASAFGAAILVSNFLIIFIATIGQATPYHEKEPLLVTLIGLTVQSIAWIVTIAALIILKTCTSYTQSAILNTCLLIFFIINLALIPLGARLCILVIRKMNG